MASAQRCGGPKAADLQLRSGPARPGASAPRPAAVGVHRRLGLGRGGRQQRPQRLPAAKAMSQGGAAPGDLAASNAGTTQPSGAALDGVSFTPGGLLFPYYCGVSAALNDLGMISPQTRLAGSSAGAIIAVFMASGLSHHDAMEAFRGLLADITANGTIGRLGSVLRAMLHDYLPDNIAELASGRVTIGMTDFGGFQKLPFDAVLIDQFHSKDDLIDAVCASCHIPYYLGPSVGSDFRGQELSDGAVTAFLPSPIPRAEALALELVGELRSIGVCAAPDTALGSEFLGQRFEVHISPSLQETPRFSPLKLGMMGLLPFSAEEGEELFELGYGDTVTWARAEAGRPEPALLSNP